MQLQASQPALRKLEWRVRHAAEAAVSGDYRTAFRGRGREFDQVVRYEWGDDVRDIDWNVTARLGEPYRKKFVEERELTVVLVFEDSPSLGFGSGQRTRREVLLETAGLFSLLAAANRDRLGLWHATPDGETVHRAHRGRAHIIRRASELLGAPAPSGVEDGRPTVVDWKRLSHVFPRHSVILWFGDFPPRDPPDTIRSLRRRFDLVGVRVDDPWDLELPDVGTLPVVDPVSGEILPLDTGSRATRQQHAAWCAARERGFEDLFPSPTNRLTVRSDADPLDTLVRFFRKRMRALVA